MWNLSASLTDTELLAWCRADFGLSALELELMHRLERALEEVDAGIAARSLMHDIETLEADRAALEAEICELRERRDRLLGDGE